MPCRLSKPCRVPGCPELVRGLPYCAQHRRLAYQYKDARRQTAAERGYDHIWAKVASQRRERDCYLCQVCLRHERITPAKTVDHIVPVHVRPDWRLELRNTQVICVPCHQQKTAEDTKTYGSSTAMRLTENQVEARRRAQALLEPSRAEGE